MKILGIIPARSGSKGVPGKNIKLLGNKPLIQFTIEAALASKSLHTVMVSTDGEDIANVCRSAGAEVPFIRPANLALDTTSSIDVVIHVLEYYRSLQDSFDAICLLQPTSPFRPTGFIDSCVQQFIDSQADALISVLPVPHEYNPHWTFESKEGSYLKIATGESEIIKRRQDLPQAYFRDGSVYLTQSDIILQQKSFLGQKTAFKVSDPARYVNIDTPDDWEKAELLWAQFYK